MPFPRLKDLKCTLECTVICLILTGKIFFVYFSIVVRILIMSHSFRGVTVQPPNAFLLFSASLAASCSIPLVIRGSWFSWENGQQTVTEMNADTMTGRGRCLFMLEEYHVNYTFIFQDDKCYHCVKLIVRTVNVLEKIESKFEAVVFELLTKINFCSGVC